MTSSSIHLINSRDLVATRDLVTKHINDGGFVVFSEVTNPLVYSHYVGEEFSGKVYFIDPQHTIAGYPGDLRSANEIKGKEGLYGSAILWTYRWEDEIYEEYYTFEYLRPILYVVEKPDMDSIGAVVLCRLILEDNILLSDDLCSKRIQDIHELYSWTQPREWNPNYQKSFEVNWSNILGANLSDFKVPIEERVEAMKAYLLRGELNSNYESQIQKEYKLLEESME